MEYTSLLQALLEDGKHSSGPVESALNTAPTSSAPNISLHRSLIFSVHAQAKAALVKILPLETMCAGLGTTKQVNSESVEQLLADAKEYVQRLDHSALRNQQKAYYLGVSAILDQRLQDASAKLRARAAKWRAPPVMSTTLLTLTDQNSTIAAEGERSAAPVEALMMYPALSVIDRSQQANAESVTQTLNEVHQLYKQMSATVHRDGERLFELCETIDTASGFMGTANDFVQKTYVMSKRYHRYIAMALLLVLAWVIVRGALRRM